MTWSMGLEKRSGACRSGEVGGSEAPGVASEACINQG